MNSISTSNQLATKMCASGYRYLYGAKDQDYTSALVNKLAKAYPSTFTTSLKAEAMKDADKGYKAIDCSGFVCKVLGISNIGSAQLRQTATKRLSVSKANAKPGMVLWKQGHVAYVGEGLKIYEAASTKTDMKVSSFESRSGHFTELLIVKGSALASGSAGTTTSTSSTSSTSTTTSARKTNPYTEPTVTVTSKAQALKMGCKTYITSGDGVRWIQFELVEAGYTEVSIDGKCGPITVNAIIKFQKSCKIVADGLAGKGTRTKLKAN